MSKEVIQDSMIDREKVHTFQKETVLKLLRAVVRDFSDEWSNRRVHISHSDSYDDPSYRVTFFCVEGSPPRVWGWITAARYGYVTKFLRYDKVETGYCDFTFERQSKEFVIYRGYRR